VLRLQWQVIEGIKDSGDLVFLRVVPSSGGQGGVLGWGG
jgi:hypothetical protein